MAEQELQLFDKDLEELVIISLLKGQDSIRDYLLGTSKEELFYHPWWKEVYHRMKNLVREKGKIPNEVDILHDPVISDDAKSAIRASSIFTQDTFIKDHVRCKSAIEQLTEVSKARKLHSVHTQLGEFLTKGKHDIRTITQALSNKLCEISTNTEDFDSSILRVTEDAESDKLVDKIFSERDDIYIPTGFEPFDKVNRGLPRGGFTLVMATTGGGKSAAALHMSKTQALAGFRVCLVSLEMDEFELIERRFSSITGISLTQLKNSSSLTTQEIENAKKKFQDYKERVKKADGSEEYKCKMNNLTVEELLYGLKPFMYDVIIIDYLGLLKGVDGDDQWRKLSEAARFCKMFAADNNIQVIGLAQLSKEGEIRYSKGMLEHANNSFSWVFGKKERETGIIEVEQKKARMSEAFPFYLRMNFATMTISDADEQAKAAYLSASTTQEGQTGNAPQKYTAKRSSFFGD